MRDQDEAMRLLTEEGQKRGDYEQHIIDDLVSTLFDEKWARTLTRQSCANLIRNAFNEAMGRNIK